MTTRTIIYKQASKQASKQEGRMKRPTLQEVEAEIDTARLPSATSSVTGWERSSELPAFPRPAECPQEATESRLSRDS